MVCGIHQPDFLPYLGFFDKFLKSDVFVLLDTVQFPSNSFRNRNQLKTSRGVIWLTVPVSMGSGAIIRDVFVANQTFIQNHLRTIELNYKRAPYFNAVFPKIQEIYTDTKIEKLIDLTVPLLRYIFSILDPDKEVLVASGMAISPEKHSTDLLIEIAKKVGADIYLSGSGGKEYLGEAKFPASGIKLQFQEFHCPTYPQLWGEFVPNLSVLDALMNVGPLNLGQLILG